jgi:hypothetical protein
MGKGNRSVPPASAEDLELFASFVRTEEQRERDVKAAEKAARRQAGELDRLVKAKEEAAAQVKRLRGSDRATADQKAAADQAYKAALAAVVAAETGAAPAWADAVAPEEAEQAQDADGAEGVAASDAPSDEVIEVIDAAAEDAGGDAGAPAEPDTEQ